MSYLLFAIKNVFVPLAIGIVGLALMSASAYFLNRGTLPLWQFSAHPIANLTLTMQLIVLPFSFLALLLSWLYRKNEFKIFFHLSLSGNHEWNVYGPLIALLFTLGTIGLMAFSVRSQHGTINETFFKLLPLVIFVSAANAWSEEIFSRFVIAAGLHKKFSADTICWISAVIFGGPHFFGTPSGVFGVITSGLLGWILAKSVIETKSIGWALLIHFLQDIVIFGAGAMIITGN